MTKSKYTEKDIIALFSQKATESHFANDAATIKHHDTAITVSQDTLNEGIHFDSTFCGPADIAHRAFCANVSDMAAMGLSGTHLVQSLSLPPNTSLAWLETYAQTLKTLCQKNHITLIGGDTCSANVLSITLTILHIGPPAHNLSRHGIQPHDCIFITKPIGNSQLGLTALQTNTNVDDYFIRAYLQPQHDVLIGQALSAAHTSVVCMDISDGLVQDLQRLCDLNQVNAFIDIDAIPEHPLFAETCQRLSLQAASTKITGGEDYALLIIGPADLPKTINTTLYPIGKINGVSDTPTIGWVHQGKPFKPNDTGFNHFGA